jgi:RHS repeat-associated protein
VNTSGVIQQRFVYTAYGLPVFLSSSFTTSSNTAAWEVLYAGYRFETATSLMHVRHRVLNPALGCWAQRDPIGYCGGVALYTYANSTPLQHTDPFGLLILNIGILITLPVWQIAAILALLGLSLFALYKLLKCVPIEIDIPNVRVKTWKMCWCCDVTPLGTWGEFRYEISNCRSTTVVDCKSQVSSYCLAAGTLEGKYDEIPYGPPI